jgi:hypothetical protein
MKVPVSLFAILFAASAGALAADGMGSSSKGMMPGGKDMSMSPGRIEQIPSGPALKPLAELKGVVSWKTLAEVQTVKRQDKFVPQFSNAISALDKKEVKLQGFMMPLEMGDKQKRFILTSMPPSCAFCLPGGPDQLVEIQAKSPVKYGFEPIVVSGKLAVLKDDPMGLYYRLTDAVLIAQ